MMILTKEEAKQAFQDTAKAWSDPESGAFAAEFYANNRDAVMPFDPIGGELLERVRASVEAAHNYFKGRGEGK